MKRSVSPSKPLGRRRSQRQLYLPTLHRYDVSIGCCLNQTLLMTRQMLVLSEGMKTYVNKSSVCAKQDTACARQDGGDGSRRLDRLYAKGDPTISHEDFAAGLARIASREGDDLALSPEDRAKITR
ncbi:hypothetical protein GQ600_27597 [Phytophthora cactorum]|nr:hypothetical protein GQ600_27597 [Phytophthora cactorum]